jgi:hypothetical protein
MLLNEDYRKRLWALPSDLFRALRADIEGPRKLFTPSEYIDPDLRATIINEISRGLKYLRYTSEQNLAGFIRSMLSPGPVLSLYSGFGDVLFRFGSGIGVEPHAGMADWSRLFAAMAGADVEIVTADVFSWTSERKYSRIICNVPRGSRGCDVEFFYSLFSLLADSGEAAIHMPSDILWCIDQRQIRKLIASNTAVSAVISLPSSLFRDSSVEYSLVILRKDVGHKTFMARPTSVGDLPAIAFDYVSWRSGAGPSIGFEVALDDLSWDCATYESRDAVVRDINYPCDVVALADIAAIGSENSVSPTAIAVSRTGDRSVWLADEPGLTPRNSIVISPSERVNPLYLLLYLNSDVGLRALGNCSKAKPVKILGASELGRVLVALPPLARQRAIVKDALAVQQAVATLESLAAEGKRALKEDIFRLDSTKCNLKLLWDTAEGAFYSTLPFPIALAYRKVADAPDDSARLTLLIELLEVAVRFVVLVMLADLDHEQSGDGISAFEIKHLYGPSLADWVALFKALAKRSRLFLKEVSDFKLDRYENTINDFIKFREELSRGNDAGTMRDRCESQVDEQAQNVYEFIASLGVLANYSLVKTGVLEKECEFYRIPLQVLMGDKSDGEKKWLISRTPFDTNRVLYMARDYQFIVLDPYIVVERCAGCERQDILLLDRISESGMSYLSCDNGKKRVIVKNNWLPSDLHRGAIRHA